jgi:UDP-3-O-[3-hydroxymyristoyl] glucosamine N-acyltransferase
VLASDIAKVLNGRLLGRDCEICGIEPLFNAKNFHLSFAIWPKDIPLAKLTEAGCIVTEIGIAAEYANEITASLIVVESIFQSFISIAKLVDGGCFPDHQSYKNTIQNINKNSLVHPSALVFSAIINEGAVIGPNVVIEQGGYVGKNTIIEAGAIIKRGVFIGENCFIGSNSVLGEDGFVPYGLNPVKNLPSLGGLIIEDSVRVKASCTIDRGLIGSTRIKKNTLIDNLVHVGHDVVIGENVVVAGQSGFAGFVRIGDHVTIGGQVGVAPHVIIEEGARISGKSMVHCDIKRYEIWSGNPSVPHGIYLRAYGKLMNGSRKKRR